MQWIITTVVFGVLFLFMIAYLFVQIHLESKKEKAAYKKGGDDTFAWILEAGHSQKVSEFHLLNEKAEPNQVVLVGDSLTDNYPVGECFLDLPYRVYNRGIGGDTTSALSSRLSESVFELNPKVVVLLIGINDFALKEGTTPKTLASSIENIVKEIKTHLPTTKIILEAIYPVNKSNAPKIDRGSVDNKDNALINETNALLKNIKGVNFLDLSSYLKDENGELKLEYTREGLHLNAKGYFAITPIITKEIEKALKE